MSASAPTPEPVPAGGGATRSLVEQLLGVKAILERSLEGCRVDAANGPSCTTRRFADTLQLHAEFCDAVARMRATLGTPAPGGGSGAVVVPAADAERNRPLIGAFTDVAASRQHRRGFGGALSQVSALLRKQCACTASLAALRTYVTRDLPAVFAGDLRLAGAATAGDAAGLAAAPAGGAVGPSAAVAGPPPPQGREVLTLTHTGSGTTVAFHFGAGTSASSGTPGGGCGDGAGAAGGDGGGSASAAAPGGGGSGGSGDAATASSNSVPLLLTAVSVDGALANASLTASLRALAFARFERELRCLLNRRERQSAAAAAAAAVAAAEKRVLRTFGAMQWAASRVDDSSATTAVGPPAVIEYFRVSRNNGGPPQGGGGTMEEEGEQQQLQQHQQSGNAVQSRPPAPATSSPPSSFALLLDFERWPTGGASADPTAAATAAADTIATTTTAVQFVLSPPLLMSGAQYCAVVLGLQRCLAAAGGAGSGGGGAGKTGASSDGDDHNGGVSDDGIDGDASVVMADHVLVAAAVDAACHGHMHAYRTAATAVITASTTPGVQSGGDTPRSSGSWSGSNSSVGYVDTPGGASSVFTDGSQFTVGGTPRGPGASLCVVDALPLSPDAAKLLIAAAGNGDGGGGGVGVGLLHARALAGTLRRVAAFNKLLQCCQALVGDSRASLSLCFPRLQLRVDVAPDPMEASAVFVRRRRVEVTVLRAATFHADAAAAKSEEGRAAPGPLVRVTVDGSETGPAGMPALPSLAALREAVAAMTGTEGPGGGAGSRACGPTAPSATAAAGLDSADDNPRKRKR